MNDAELLGYDSLVNNTGLCKLSVFSVVSG